MAKGRRPNLFIVGAPKCGTTALYTYLGRHGDVFMARHKEPCYLAPDFDSPLYPKSEDEYLALFADAREEKWVGEATTTYLYSELAAREIKRFSPDARIIVLLRDPVDMIHALHSEYLYQGIEDVRDLAEALEAEEARKEGEHLPAGMAFPAAYLFYREIARFVPQVRRYFSVFGRERVLVIIYDDFKNDTVAEFRRTCRFLGIDPHVDVDLTVVNPNKRVRNMRLLALLRSPPAFAGCLKRIIPRPIWRAISVSLRSIAVTYSKRPPMPPELRRSLIREFAPHVEQLGKLLCRDLTSWLRA